MKPNQSRNLRNTWQSRSNAGNDTWRSTRSQDWKQNDNNPKDATDSFNNIQNQKSPNWVFKWIKNIEVLKCDNYPTYLPNLWHSWGSIWDQQFHGCRWKEQDYLPLVECMPVSKTTCKGNRKEDHTDTHASRQLTSDRSCNDVTTKLQEFFGTKNPQTGYLKELKLLQY